MRGVSGTGDTWCADEGGSTFGAAQQQVTALAREMLDLVTAGLETAGHNVHVMGDDFDMMDTAMRDAFERISGQPGGPA